MGSRQELIGWVNELLHTNYTKVEQLGSGAAYCQIVDSIYGDVKLERVKFTANQEYEYVENFKILLNAFAKHKVDKPIDPTKLIKCRFQDNFEFLQWLRRFWDSYAPNTGYDAVGRRQGRAAGPVDTRRPISSASSGRGSSVGAYRRPAGGAVGARAPVAQRAPIRAQQQQAGGQQVAELTRQLGEHKAMIETAEKERDFYFIKLREIEMYLQATEFPEGSELDNMAKHIQGILYSTEETDADAAHIAADEYQAPEPQHMDEEETF
ncbi:microtubule integrity protein mal3 [Coemansia interrupta]|uniref:Microtubule integrity protein mal3 n=1 Tax=Coemansia interrupta TaxID=1126814 RepID=A0A9W8HD49_9FUNG|nr:microtubule integrity protein mal3 [Coemansia interrupta]